MNSDFKELLNIFTANGVRYLVVGGYAVMRYAEPRYTKDLDLWISPDPVNARAVFQSLQQFGAPLSGLTETDFTQAGSFYQMGRPPLRVDILMSIAGVEFEAAWRNRVSEDFDGVAVWLISRQDLIANKRAAGRPQDLLDAEALAVAQKQDLQ